MYKHLSGDASFGLLRNPDVFYGRCGVLTKRASEGLPFLAKSSRLHSPRCPVQQKLDSVLASPTGPTVLAKTVELCEAVSAIGAAATELCTGLNAQQLSWRPQPQKWSIAQNLAHLRTT